MAVALVILSSLVGFASEQLRLVESQKAVKTAEVSLQKLVDAANQVYGQGNGATRTVEIIWPEGLESEYTLIEEQTIQVRTHGRTIYATAIPILTGSLPTYAGYHSLRVRAFDGFVGIGEVSLSVFPSSIFAPLDRNDSSSHTLTILNGEGDVNLVYTTDWNTLSYADVNLTLSRTDANNVAAGTTTTLDLNFYSTAQATGSFAGKLWIQGTFVDRVETLLVPLKASIALESESDIETYPSSLSISTYSTDTNSSSFQLCNVGGTILKTISITPSSGDAGDWIQGISTLASLAPLTCHQVTVSATPSSSTTGTFTGSLYISDYSGQNSVIVPIQVYVGGMDAIFSWNWDHALRSPNSIKDFTLSNLGSSPIEMKEVKLRNWVTCDSQDSNVTGLSFNDVELFSEASVDGNWIDITDVNLPILTSWTSNEIQFAGNIGDENETFIADVLFSDGTTYTSPTFGGGCPDTIAPSKVSDLRAHPGPAAGSVRLLFTYPGDDANMGSPSSVVLKYDTTSNLGNENKFASGIPYSYEGPFQSGGTQGEIHVYDLNVGYSYYFALKFSDDNGNQATLSTNTNARPWNSFRWSSGDFNFATMPLSIKGTGTGTGDVNLFQLSNVSVDGSSTHEVGIRISSDSNTLHGWTSLMDFNATHLTRVRIWYPSPSDTIPETSPQYDVNKNLSLASAINMMANSFGGATYNYSGTAVSMPATNHFNVVLATGMVDFNFTMDRDDPSVVPG
jgi:hypothetical protein